MNRAKSVYLVALVVLALIFSQSAFAQTAVPGTIQDTSQNLNISYHFDNETQVIILNVSPNTLLLSDYLTFTINDTAAVNISSYVGAFWGCTKVYGSGPQNQYIVCLSMLGLGSCKLVGSVKICHLNLTSANYIYPWITLQLYKLFSSGTPVFKVNYSLLDSLKPIFDTQHVWILPLLVNNTSELQESNVTLELGIAPYQWLYLNATDLLPEFNLSDKYSKPNISLINYTNFYVLPYVQAFAKKYLLYPLPFKLQILQPNQTAILLEKSSSNSSLYIGEYNVTLRFYNPYYLAKGVFGHSILFKSSSSLGPLKFNEFEPKNLSVFVEFNFSGALCSVKFLNYVYLIDNYSGKIIAVLPASNSSKTPVIVTNLSSEGLVDYKFLIQSFPNYSSDTIIRIPFNITCQNLDPPYVTVVTYPRDYAFVANVSLYLTPTPLQASASSSKFYSTGLLVYLPAIGEENLTNSSVIAAKTLTDQFAIAKQLTKNASQLLGSEANISIYLYKRAEIDPNSDFFRLVINLSYPFSSYTLHVYYYNSSSKQVTSIDQYCQAFAQSSNQIVITCNITGFSLAQLKDYVIVNLTVLTSYNAEGFCAASYALENASSYTLKDSFCLTPCSIHLVNVTYLSLLNPNSSFTDTKDLTRLFFADGDQVQVNFWTACPNIIVVRNCSSTGCYALNAQSENLSCNYSAGIYYCRLTINVTSWEFNYTLNYYIFTSFNSSAWNTTFGSSQNGLYAINVSNLPSFITQQGDYKALKVYKLYPVNITLQLPRIVKLLNYSSYYSATVPGNFSVTLPSYCDDVCRNVPFNGEFSLPFFLDVSGYNLSLLGIGSQVISGPGKASLKPLIVNKGFYYYYFILNYTEALNSTTRFYLQINFSGSLDWPYMFFFNRSFLSLPENLTFYYQHASNLTEFYYNLTTNRVYLVPGWIMPETAYVGFWNASFGAIHLLVTVPFKVISRETVPVAVLSFNSSIFRIQTISLLGIYPPAENVSITGNSVVILRWNISQAVQNPVVILDLLVEPPATYNGSITVQLPTRVNLTGNETSKLVNSEIIASSPFSSNITVFYYPNNTANFYLLPYIYGKSRFSGSLQQIFSLRLYRLANSSFSSRLVAAGYLVYNRSIPLQIKFELYNAQGVLKHEQNVSHYNGTADFTWTKVIYDQFGIKATGYSCIGFDPLGTSITITNYGNAAFNVTFNISLLRGAENFTVTNLATLGASCQVLRQSLDYATIYCSRIDSLGQVIINYAAIQNISYNYTLFNVTVYVDGRYVDSHYLSVPNCGEPWIYVGLGCKYPRTPQPINETLYAQLHLVRGYPWNKSLELRIGSLCFANSLEFNFSPTQLNNLGLVTVLSNQSFGCCSLNILPVNVPMDQLKIVTSCEKVPSCLPDSFYIGDFVNVIYQGPNYFSDKDKAIVTEFLLLPSVNESIYIGSVTIALQGATFSDGSSKKVLVLDTTLKPGDNLSLGPFTLSISPGTDNVWINVVVSETSVSTGIESNESYTFLVTKFVPSANASAAGNLSNASVSSVPANCIVTLRPSSCSLTGCQLPNLLSINASETCSDNLVHPYVLGFYVASYNGSILVANQTPLVCNRANCRFVLLVNVSKLGTWGYIVLYAKSVTGQTLYTQCTCPKCLIGIDTRSRLSVKILDVATTVNGNTYHWCYCPQRYSSVEVLVENQQPISYPSALLNLSFYYNLSLLNSYAQQLSIAKCSAQRVSFNVIPSTEAFSMIIANASVLYRTLLGSVAKNLSLCPGCISCYTLKASEVSPLKLTCNDWIDNGTYYYYDKLNISVSFVRFNDSSCASLNPVISFTTVPAGIKDAYKLECKLVSKSVKPLGGQLVNYTLNYSCTLYKVKKFAYPEPLPNGVTLNIYFQFNPLLAKHYLGSVNDTCFSSQVHQVCLVDKQWLHDALDVGEVFDSLGNLRYKVYICGWDYEYKEYQSCLCCAYIAGKGWTDLAKYNNCTYSVPLAEILYAQGKTDARNYVVQYWLAKSAVYPWNLSVSSFVASSCGNLEDPACLSALLSGSKFYRPSTAFCCGSCGGLGSCQLINGTCVCVPKIADPCFRAAVLVCAYRVAVSKGSLSCQQACQYVIDSGKAQQYCQQIVSQANGNPSVILLLLKYDAFRLDRYTLRPVADSRCPIGELCKLYAGPVPVDRSFKAGFRAGQCVPAALEFGSQCSQPDFEYYINYSLFSAACSAWFGAVGLASLATSVPEICYYQRTGCKVTAGGVYSIAYNFTSKNLGWTASCGDYPCVSSLENVTMVEQIYMLLRNGSTWLWCRYGTKSVSEAGDCEQIFAYIRQVGGIDQALKNPNFKFFKIKVPYYLANKTVISFVGNSIYILGQVKIPQSASKIFATITPNNQILLNWILLRKPVSISSVPETPSVILSVLEVLVLALLMLRKERKTRS